jgi:hypothetical protein
MATVPKSLTVLQMQKLILVCKTVKLFWTVDMKVDTRAPAGAALSSTLFDTPAGSRRTLGLSAPGLSSGVFGVSWQ